MSSRDNIHKTFTVMHNQVFEHSDTLSFALLAFIILCINGKLFRCSFFHFCSVYYKWSQVCTIFQSCLTVFLKVLKDTAHHSTSSETQNQGILNLKSSINTFAYLSLKANSADTYLRCSH